MIAYMCVLAYLAMGIYTMRLSYKWDQSPYDPKDLGLLLLFIPLWPILLPVFFFMTTEQRAKARGGPSRTTKFIAKVMGTTVKGQK